MIRKSDGTIVEFPLAKFADVVHETSHLKTEFTAMVVEDPDDPTKVVRMIRMRRIESSDDLGEPDSVDAEFMVTMPLMESFTSAMLLARKVCDELTENLDATISG